LTKRVPALKGNRRGEEKPDKKREKYEKKRNCAKKKKKRGFVILKVSTKSRTKRSAGEGIFVRVGGKPAKEEKAPPGVPIKARKRLEKKGACREDVNGKENPPWNVL